MHQVSHQIINVVLNYTRPEISGHSDDMVAGFSCKGGGLCPSCGGRRMSGLAAHLVDRVLPRVPVRQWVFTVPVPVRYQFAFDAALTRAVLRVFLHTVFGWLRHAAARQGVLGGRCGAVTAIQRFAGELNLNIRFHSLAWLPHSPDAAPGLSTAPPS